MERMDLETIVSLKFVMYGIVNSSLCLAGLSGNFLMLYIFIIYQDMRKQSINIYLTVLALYDNGVLIFSILMLNLPAITDYQQMALSPSHLPASTTSGVHHVHHPHFTTPIFTSFPSSTISHHLSSSTLLNPFTPTTTGSGLRAPLDTGQNGTSSHRHYVSTTIASHHAAPVNWTQSGAAFSSTPMFVSSSSSSSFNTFTPTPTTTSMPFLSQSQSSSSPSGFTPTSGVTNSIRSSTSHQIRHSSSLAPGQHHRSKRAKRHAPSLITAPIRDIFQWCLNLTSDDLANLKRNMILLNESAELKNSESTESNAELMDQLFFEALLRQLILWVRISWHSRLSQSSVKPPKLDPNNPQQQYPTTITDLVRCRHSLVEFYRQEVPQNDQGSVTTSVPPSPSTSSHPFVSNLQDHRASEPESSQPDSKQSRESEESDEEATQNLLLLNTLEDIYRSRPWAVDTTIFPQGYHYADSLTGEESTSQDGYQSRSSTANGTGSEDDEDEPDAEFQPAPPGSMYPLIYYVKIVYPLALISQTGSIWTTCLITIERYLAVCHPLMSLTLSTRSRAIWALSILSAAAFLFNLPRFAEVDTTGDSIRPTELRRNQIYYHVYYICLNLSLNYILPLSLLSALNIKIYASVRHANAHRNELTRARQSELHLASMLVLIVAIFIACNAPAFLVNCMEPYFDVGNPLMESITIFSNVLVCFNSAINFVIYCIFGKKFRSKLKQALGLRGSHCLTRGGSGRHLRARNRSTYFSRHFSTASRNSSFKLTMATHLNANNNNSNNLINNNNNTRSYSYPHTALPAVVTDSLQNGATTDNKSYKNGSDKDHACNNNNSYKTKNSPNNKKCATTNNSIPMDNFSPVNGENHHHQQQQYHHHSPSPHHNHNKNHHNNSLPNNLYDHEGAIALNTFV